MVGSLYPLEIDTSATLPVAHTSTPLDPSLINILRQTIIYVEQELGIKPSGTYATVRARLDALEDLINNGGGGGGGGGGGITFSGDLFGNSSYQKVIGISGVPILVSSPSIGQTLIFDGSKLVFSSDFISANITTTGSGNFGSINSTGAGNFGSITTTGDGYIKGNLTVLGTTTTIDSEVVDIEARIIHLNYAPMGNIPVPMLITGLEAERGDHDGTKRDAAAILWDESLQKWTFAFQTEADDTNIGSFLNIKALGAQFTGLSGAGNGYIQVDSSGTFSRVSTIPSGGMTPGTAGQIFITNNTPAATWTSLISVDTTHGRLTAGGSGTDSFATIGPRVGFESSGAMLWLLPNGVAPDGAYNYALDGDGTNVSLNAVNPGGAIYFNAGGYTVANITGAHGTFTSGGNGSDFKAMIGPLPGFETTDAGFWTIPSAWTPTAANSSLFGDGNNAILNAPSGFIDFRISNSAYLARYSTTKASFNIPIAFPGSSGSSPVAASGDIRAANNTTIIAARNAANTADLPIISTDSSDTVKISADATGVNTHIGYSTGVGAGSTFIAGNPVTISSYDGGGSVWLRGAVGLWGATHTITDITTVHQLSFTPGASYTQVIGTEVSDYKWTWSAPVSDVATGNLTISAQAPYASATGTNRNPGTTVINIPAPTAATNFNGGFVVDTDGVPAVRMGYYAGNDTTYAGIWFRDAGSPTTANFGFLGNQSYTYLNTPTGGSVVLSINGTASTGLTNTFNSSGTGTWTMQAGAGVGNWNIGTNVSGGSLTLKAGTASTVATLTSTLADFASGVGVRIEALAGFGDGYVAVDNSGNLSWSSGGVGGGPGTAGQIYITNATPAAAWTSLISVDTTHGRLMSGGTGSDYFALIGPDVGYENIASCVWLLSNGATASNTNYALAGDGTDVYLNAVGSTGQIHISANHADLALINQTSSTFVPSTLAFAEATTAPTFGQFTTSTASGQALTIQAQPSTFTTGNGGTLNLFSGTPGSGGTPGAVNIATNAANIVTTIGYNNGVGAGSTVLTGSPLYMYSYGGAGGIDVYCSSIGWDWGGALGGFVTWDLNNLGWHNLATAPKLSTMTATSDVATTNITIQAQAPYASASTAHGNAGDVVINTAASVNSAVKYGGLQFVYAGAADGYIGTMQGAGFGIWTSATPTANNFTLFADGTNTMLSASSGLFFRINGTTSLGDWTTTRLSVITRLEAGSQTDNNILTGGLIETTRASVSSYTLDASINDRHVFVTTTQTITLSAGAHANGRQVTFWIDTTSTGSNGTDITLTISPSGSEKINGTNANWIVTIPGSPKQVQRLESIGDGTNIRIA